MICYIFLICNLPIIVSEVFYSVLESLVIFRAFFKKLLYLI